MALTADEISYIRQNSGDNDTTPEVSNATLQVIYDSTTEGMSSLDRTVYFVIRRRLGLAAALVATSTPDIPSSVSANQKFEQLERLMKLWAGITGIVGGGGVVIGSSSTFTYRADSRQTSEPDYSTDYTAVADDV